LGIEILDAIDGDADLEDGGEGEPSLAFLSAGKVRCAGVPAAMMTGSRRFAQPPSDSDDNVIPWPE
jgi:hypothetical protein